MAQPEKYQLGINSSAATLQVHGLRPSAVKYVRAYYIPLHVLTVESWYTFTMTVIKSESAGGKGLDALHHAPSIVTESWYLVVARLRFEPATAHISILRSSGIAHDFTTDTPSRCNLLTNLGRTQAYSGIQKARARSPLPQTPSPSGRDMCLQHSIMGPTSDLWVFPCHAWKLCIS
jgi:hypothetical protein